MKNNTLGIYIHVPFCKSKCPYCDFYSVTPTKTESYVQKMCAELERWGKRLDNTIDTIYFGGGTPSLLGSDKICKIINSVKNNFKVSNAEITMEVNPADYKLVDFEKLNFYGMNRISVGAQSLSNAELKTLGRRHDSSNIFSTHKQIKASGINNISFDMILGIPHQTEKSIDEFLDFCRENNIPHISAYLLKIEKGTPFYKNQEALELPTEGESISIYDYVCNALKSYGFNHYEISNFARSGFESRHNLKYWNLDEYLGIGPSAHSLIDNERFFYPNNLDDFISDSEIFSEGECEPEKEYAMLRLRLAEGLSCGEYRKKFNKDIPEIHFERAQKYIEPKLVVCDDSGLRLTEKGFLLSNSIIADILW